MSEDDPVAKKDNVGEHPFKRYMHPDSNPKTFENIAQFIRNTFVLPFRTSERPVYYHRKYDRVPTVDQCEVDDVVCLFEAEQQWARDKKVDNMKLKIMRKRLTECYYYWGKSGGEKCQSEKAEWEQNAVNWFIKYGDLGRTDGAVDSYMKQKHRMIFLRRKQEEGIDVAYNEDRTY